MKKYKNAFFYIFTIAGFSGLIYFILHKVLSLEGNKVTHLFPRFQLLLVFVISDSFQLIYAQKIIHNNDARVTVFDSTGVIKQNPEMKEVIRSIEQAAPHHITLYDESSIGRDFLAGQDLMMISLDSWKKAIETQSSWLPQAPSTLIVKA